MNILCFENSFHGRTIGSVAITTSKAVYRHKFGPGMPGVLVAPYPYCLHCVAKRGCSKGPGVDPTEQCCMGEGPPPSADGRRPLLRTCPWRPDDSLPFPRKKNMPPGPLESIEYMLKQQSVPEDVAAIVIEPILGEGGFLTPPAGFLRALRQICDKHGILLVFDEVQAGVGRTGKWWGHQHFDGAPKPDMLIFAKGIGSGMPIAGIAANGAFLGLVAPAAAR